MRTMARRCAVTAAGAAAVTVLVSPLAGAAGPAGPVGGAGLRLSVHDGQSGRMPLFGGTTLTCDPDGGSHPRAAAACRALERAGGSLEKVTGRTGVCPMIYKPVTAVANGRWGLRPVHFTHVYANACVMRNALSPVYDF